MLPPDSTPEEIAFYMLSEYGVWPYKEPLFELPPETAFKILYLMQRDTPYRAAHLSEIRDEIRQMNQLLTEHLQQM